MRHVRKPRFITEAESVKLMQRLCFLQTSGCNECRQVEENCDLRIRAWEARDIQLEVRVGAKRESLSKLVARLKHDRMDDDAEYDAVHSASLGVSPLRRRTERGSATRQMCHCFIQDSSTTGVANQFASHV